MITILIGISGSGKTTLAKEMISKNKNLVRINRDDLRKNFIWSRPNRFFLLS